MLIPVILFSLLFVVIFISRNKMEKIDARLRECGVPVKARVIKVDNFSYKTGMYTIMFEYEVDGQKYQRDYSSKYCPNVDTDIDVKYDFADPETAMPDDRSIMDSYRIRTTFYMAVTIIAVVVSLMIGISKGNFI